MRYTQRLLSLAVISVCTTILLFLFRDSLIRDKTSTTFYDRVSALKDSYSWTTTATKDSLPKRTILRDTPPVSTADLWPFWHQAFEDARPRIDKVRLRSQAGNYKLATTHASPTLHRDPPVDRVINSPEDIAALSAAHALFLRTLHSRKENESGEDVFTGRGVVMVGGGEYFGPAIVGIQMLRKAGSDIPVEVFVADEDEWEAYLCETYLPKLGAKCLIMTDFLQSEMDAGMEDGDEKKEKEKENGDEKKEKKEEKVQKKEKKKGRAGVNVQVSHYQLKSLAMLFSSFADLLYLDSDSIPLVNPTTTLFETAPYNDTGLVTWPDFWISTESPRFYTIAGMQGGFPEGRLPKTSTEAGQLLINKKTHLKTLLLANYYNLYGPRIYYPLLSQGALGQGDKETFLAAATVLNEPWFRVETGVEAIERFVGGKYKGSAMLQHYPLYTTTTTTTASGEFGEGGGGGGGRVQQVFLHANTPKMNAGHLIDEGDLLDEEGNRVRLWGPRDTEVKKLGRDVERDVWELMVQTGCELHHVVNDWKDREDMCARLKEHWGEVFESSSSLHTNTLI